MPHNRTTYTPEPDGVFTVGQLIEILSKANKDAYIVVGRGMNDCDDHIERIYIADNIVGFFTESADEYMICQNSDRILYHRPSWAVFLCPFSVTYSETPWSAVLRRFLFTPILIRSTRHRRFWTCFCPSGGVLSVLRPCGAFWCGAVRPRFCCSVSAARFVSFCPASDGPSRHARSDPWCSARPARGGPAPFWFHGSALILKTALFWLAALILAEEPAPFCSDKTVLFCLFQFPLDLSTFSVLHSSHINEQPDVT